VDFSNTSVLCVGDLMLDRYIYADMERISPEAPVPVLRLKHTREMLGGAGNVANNIASLGGRAILVGVMGRDATGDCLKRVLANLPAIEAAYIDSDERPTSCKTRFIAANQQVVRTDDESLTPLSAEEHAKLSTSIRAWIGRVGAVVLSDYGKGVLTPTMVAEVIAAARAAKVPVFVDPKSSDFSHYKGATCITPNLKELAAASGEAVTDVAGITRAARRVMAQAQSDAILVTRSDKGMMLFEATGEVHSVPARAREVFDVSGAGDTVIATLALCVAAGRTLPQAMPVANAAASVVVSKLGAATADMAELMHEFEEQDQDGATVIAPGAQSLDRVRELVARWKQQGMVVGFTNGCFDLIHPGHIALLARARSECDRLVVGLNTDRSVRALKGPTRPVNALDARAAVMAALRYVDCVVAFDEDTPLELIRTLAPDVLIKGADYSVDEVVGGDLVRAAGGRVVLAKLVPGKSTTRTIDRLLGVHPVA
jgi:D-beta-D-heptose 7-phosphate kinase/D-beta-D-heptose 1-phosphate adenosyltransferase